MKYESIVTQPVIETERFDLRPLRMSDTGLIGLHLADTRVATNTSSIPHPLPPGWVDAMLERASSEGRAEDFWAMDGTKVGGPEIMGVISLTRMDRDQSEVGYWVAPAFWNSGVASAAVESLLTANPQECRTIFATVFQDNAASARVLTNAGFQYLGDAESFSVARNSKVPTWTYSHKIN